MVLQKRNLLIGLLIANLLMLPCCPSGQAEVAGGAAAAVGKAIADQPAPLERTATSVNVPKSAGCAKSFKTESEIPVLGKRAMRHTPHEGEVFKLDKSPLGNRKVLVLVHGGGAEKRPYMRWGKLAKSLNSDPEFSKRFKIYFFRYNTDIKLDETAPQFKDAILKLKTATGVNQISILCLSMGGNLAQRAMLDPQVESAVDLVFSMASPFHGSPLFSQGWFQYSLDDPWYMPWAKPVHNLDYLLYFSRHKILQDDLKWDNFDQMIPNIGQFKSELGLAGEGTLTPKDNGNPELAQINESTKINKSKFVTYGGYIYNTYLMTGKRRLLEETLIAPFHYIFVKLPVQIGREHPALRMLNAEMSNLAVNPDAPVYGPPSPHSYVLNDGITPVSSALYLPPSVIRDNPMLMEGHLSALHNASDVHLVRVFKDMDHISFLDGKPPHRVGKQKLSDQVHPEDGERKIFQWVAQDLLNYVSDGAAAQAIPNKSGR